MASLYEMTSEYRKLFDSYEAIDDMEFISDGKGGYTDDDGNPIDPDVYREELKKVWFDTLEAMEGEINFKLENIALYVKNLRCEADCIEAEKKRLDTRLKAKRNAVERLKKYLLDCMTAANINKIEVPKVLAFVRNNPESAVISDEEKFIEWAEKNNEDFLRYKAPEVNKTAVKSALKSGEKIPFAELARSRSVTIK